MKINIPPYLQALPQLLHHPRLPDISAVVLGVASLYGAAALTWQVIGLALPAESGSPMLAMAPGAQGRATANQIAGLSLFGGETQAAAPYGSTSMMDAPDTQLNLQLMGIIASSNPNIARAIIAANGGPEAYYAIGASLPGGAIIRAIYDDRVILEYNGRYEALRLPKTILAVITPSAPKTSTQKNSDKGKEVKVSLNAEEISQYRQQLLNDPMSLNGKIRFRTVTEGGRVKGLRAYPGTDVPLFNKLGLQGGDVITAINGIPVGDTVAMTNLYSQLGSMSEIKVEFERMGQKKFIQVPLNR